MTEQRSNLKHLSVEIVDQLEELGGVDLYEDLFWTLRRQAAEGLLVDPLWLDGSLLG